LIIDTYNFRVNKYNSWQIIHFILEHYRFMLFINFFNQKRSEKLKLTPNMRVALQNDPSAAEFSRQLLALGN